MLISIRSAPIVCEGLHEIIDNLATLPVERWSNSVGTGHIVYLTAYLVRVHRSFVMKERELY